MIVIGIDPGASGGIAWNKPSFGIQAIKRPETEQGVVEVLESVVTSAQGGLVTQKPIVRLYIEKVTGYVKSQPGEEDRANRQPGHTMFNFGRGVGVIIGAALALGIEVHEVAPVTWQKPLFLPKFKSQGDRKRELKNIAQRKYPGIKVTLSLADALLIRYYGALLSQWDKGETK